MRPDAGFDSHVARRVDRSAGATSSVARRWLSLRGAETIPLKTDPYRGSKRGRLSKPRGRVRRGADLSHSERRFALCVPQSPFRISRPDRRMSERARADGLRPWQPRRATPSPNSPRSRRRCKPRFPDWPVEHGYLEFARPVIRDGLDRLVAAGARRILAVPGMLFAAGHAKNDIPSVLNTYQAGQPGLIDRIRPRARHRPAHDPRRRRRASDEALARGRRRRRCTTRCSSSSGAAPPIPTPIPTSPR